MRLTLKIFGVVLLLYLLFWLGVAVYFSYLERQKTLFEQHLGSIFGSTVAIGDIDTSWNKFTPHISIRDFRVDGELSDQPAFAFESLEARLSPWSLLTFWPKFTKFSVQSPELEIVSSGFDRLTIAGIDLSLGTSSGARTPKRIVQWLLDQTGSAWTDGQIIWRRDNDNIQRFTDIRFIYQRQNQQRELEASFVGDNGRIAFKASSDGDLLSDRHWDAALQIIADDGAPVLMPDDLVLKVENGQGALRLKELEIQSIRDFIQLFGVSEDVSWLYNADLNGRLHDMSVSFSGPLLALEGWHLQAAASNVGFIATSVFPAMNNLSGELQVSKKGGQFLFSTQEAIFDWRQRFDTPFKIKQASGYFAWDVMGNGTVKISLKDGVFEDLNCKIENVQAFTEINNRVRRISSLGELFKVDSIAELDYRGEDIVQPIEATNLPLSVEVSADFSMQALTNFSEYLPKSKNLQVLREWWWGALSSGSITNGTASFKGPVSFKAMNEGYANFDLQADFSDVDIDYGKKWGWPKITKGKGVFRINNDVLSVDAQDGYLEGDKVRNVELSVSNLFTREIALDINGQVTKPLGDVVEFIFNGPIVSKENRLQTPPLHAQGGDVDLDLSVQVPLFALKQAKVVAQAKINNGSVLLPGGVPLDDVNGTVNVTEKSVNAKKLTGRFLGNEVTASVVTKTPKLPLAFQINAKGIASLGALEPWVGEHLLSVVSGTAPWQGSVSVDGGSLSINASSNLAGVSVVTPAPLGKVAEQSRELNLSMNFGAKVSPSIRMDYADVLRLDMQANNANGALFDRALIQVGDVFLEQKLDQGIHFDIRDEDINIDEWLDAVIELAQFQPKKQLQNSVFLDSMRSINVSTKSPFLLDRNFGLLTISMLSVDGRYWIAEANGENLLGTMQLNPRKNRYVFNLKKMNLPAVEKLEGNIVPQIDYSVLTANYPSIDIQIDDFQIEGKKFGRLSLLGEASDQAWELKQFEMQHNGVKTIASGKWVNQKGLGSTSSFDFATTIAQAESALDDVSLNGFIKKGDGTIEGNINWIGAPHEFDYSRLNGEFDLRVNNGELVKVEPGGGKLLGLLNFNAVARRLTLDFRDVFASGLTFDRMQYSGFFADGKALMREAYILAPSVFVRMEGHVDLASEMIDMEIHMSPELGGNLALLSALANPAAGAVVFLTQRVFQDEIRDANFISFRALGTWEDFELERFNVATNEIVTESKPKVEQESAQTEEQNE